MVISSGGGKLDEGWDANTGLRPLESGNLSLVFQLLQLLQGEIDGRDMKRWGLHSMKHEDRPGCSQAHLSYRIGPGHRLQEGIEQMNRALLPLLQAAGEAFLTSTVLHGQFALHACILYDATTPDDLCILLESVRHAAELFRKQEQ